MINAGVIGLGVGESHAEAYIENPLSSLIAVADFDEKKQFTRGNVEHFSDANAIIEHPDISLVSICSWDNFHADQICRCIENGKHIFVEKPLCLTFEEMVRIHDTLRANPNVRMSSNLILRRYPRFSKLKQEIESGSMGTVYYLEKIFG